MATLFALERLLPGMRAPVTHKDTFPPKASAAFLTHVGLLPGMSMEYASVTFEMCFLRKPLVAQLAAEWSFAGMNAVVSLEIAFFAESCATLLAAVGPLTGMGPCVYVESPFIRKTFPALLALVGFFFDVCESMELEAVFPLKVLTAQVAVKVRSVTMNALVNLQIFCEVKQSAHFSHWKGFSPE